MKDTDIQGLELLRQYSIRVNMGFATLCNPAGPTTCITDPDLLELLVSLGVEYSYAQPNAGLTMMEVGHDE